MEYASPSSPGLSMVGQGGQQQSSNLNNGGSIPTRGSSSAAAEDFVEYNQHNSVSLLKAQLKVRNSATVRTTQMVSIYIPDNT